ncbi:hypothetical protein BD414DRAFT_294928 [Trametes punicea]|nr:hypothetical protein BD414DRAFT_294928 [Trametes punicea]
MTSAGGHQECSAELEETQACLKCAHVTGGNPARGLGEGGQRDEARKNSRRRSRIVQTSLEAPSTRGVCTRPVGDRCVWTTVLDQVRCSAEGVNCGACWRETVETGSRPGGERLRAVINPAWRSVRDRAARLRAVCLFVFSVVLAGSRRRAQRAAVHCGVAQACRGEDEPERAQNAGRGCDAKRHN